MKPQPILGVVLVVLVMSVPGRADRASTAYNRGTHAETHNQYDQAYEAYSEAHKLKPNDPKYFAAYARVRFQVAGEHVRTGQQLQAAGNLQQALAEFQLAAKIDTTNFVAEAEIRQTEEMIRKQARGKELAPAALEPLAKESANAGGPVELEPLSSTQINLRLTESVSFVYKTIGKLAGINVLFDSDFKPAKLSIELNNVTLREALDAVAIQSKTFWQATSSNTIVVAADTATKRKELQNTVMKAFYLKNVQNPAELQEAANTLKGILDINRIQIIPIQSALVLRGTPDQMVLANLLLQDIDKPKSEVMIDIAVLQVSRNITRTLGAVPPSTLTVTVAPSGGSVSTGTSTTGTTSSGNSLTLDSLRYLNASNFVISPLSYSLAAIAGDGNTKVLQKPQLWALNNEKATLKIGDRIPIATGSFGSSGGTQGYGALVNTQFQYIDVGVNIDITPHIHSDREVTLKMTLEISSVTGTTSIGGISQPTIGQRRVDLELRLLDGEVNLVGGILEDTETQSLSGYPGLLKAPILKYLFAQETKQRQENEIVFAITPHIVRSQEVTDENLRLVDLGAGSTVTIRHTDSGKASAVPSPTAPQPGPTHDGQTPPPDPKTTGRPPSPTHDSPASSIGGAAETSGPHTPSGASLLRGPADASNLNPRQASLDGTSPVRPPP